ncbi:MAG: hypothetical protein ACFB11_02295 [Paracoccaceae bacterium]
MSATYQSGVVACAALRNFHGQDFRAENMFAALKFGDVHMLVTLIEAIDDLAFLAGATATRGLRDVDALTHRLYNPVWSLGQAQ